MEQVAHYCIIRSDLPHGTQAAQLIHAAGESSNGDIRPGTYAIALAARDQAHLFEIACRLMREGIPIAKVVENDPPYDGQLMAIGVVPMERSKIRPLLSDLPLVR